MRNEHHLRRILSSYPEYYHEPERICPWGKTVPTHPRPVHPPARGKVIAIPQLGGLHHHYERLPD
jgi:hypothetical protein